MKDGAPLLHDDLHHRSRWARRPTSRTNVAKHLQFELGDVEQGLRRGRRRRRARVPHGHGPPGLHRAAQRHRPVERRRPADHLEQHAGRVRRPRSRWPSCCRSRVSRIKVVPMEIGGGFGGKIRVYLEPVAALLSSKTGRPVKMVMNRAEVFEGTGPTPGSLHPRQDGRRQGRQARRRRGLPGLRGRRLSRLAGRRRLHVRLRLLRHPERAASTATTSCVNKPTTVGLPRAGRDQRRLRLRDGRRRDLPRSWRSTRSSSASRTPPRKARAAPTARSIPRIGMIETRRGGARSTRTTSAPLDGPNRGRGVAIGLLVQRRPASRAATASVNADGTVSLVEGSTDIGGTRTSHRHAARRDARASAPRTCDPSVGDTDSVGYTDVTGGSRVTFATGWAAYEAAQDIKRQMIERAAQIWEVRARRRSPTRTASSRCRSDRPSALTFKELAAQARTTRAAPVVGPGQRRSAAARRRPSPRTSSTSRSIPRPAR